MEWNVEQSDALTYLRALPSMSIDLVLTDPPYESLEKHRAIGTKTRLKKSKASSSEWFDIFPNDKFEELFHELYRVLKKNTHCYVFCDQETMFVMKPIGEAAGFKFWKPLVWDKCRIGMGYHYRATYEFILFFEKGKRKIKDLGTPDVLRYKRLPNGLGYPAEKPVGLGIKLISQSTELDELVCDPFCGSGAFGESALRVNRHFTGCDSSEVAVKLTKERLVKPTQLILQ